MWARLCSRRPVGELQDLDRIVGRGTVLVVGGLGALGGAVAAWLVEKGARRLVLAGRTVQADAELLTSLQAGGADVAFEPMDVTNAEAVEAVLRRIRASGSPLTAIFHAAGVVQDRVLAGSRGRAIARPRQRRSRVRGTALSDAS